jgi:serine/threonine-protein phosphatase 2A regulatory subunit A
MENLNPLDVLKEELDTDEVTQKINAIHKLRIVATLLGPEGIRNTLLPYLDSKYSLTQP